MRSKASGGPRGSFRNRGVTLLELLVVIVIMAMIASIVLPTIRSRRLSIDDSKHSVEDVVVAARKTAVLKGMPLRLRIDLDGAWALAGDASGEVMGGGVIQESTRKARSSILQGEMTLLVDAVGACMPEGSLNGSGTIAAFDPIACRMVTANTP